MRISDWSSDVCSSDLSTDTIPGLSKVVANATVYYENQGFAIRLSDRYRDKYRGEYSALFGQRQYRYTLPENQLDLDRKSVVEGKSVSVRVDLGGRRIIKKKNQHNHNHEKSPHK